MWFDVFPLKLRAGLRTSPGSRDVFLTTFQAATRSVSMSFQVWKDIVVPCPWALLWGVQLGFSLVGGLSMKFGSGSGDSVSVPLQIALKRPSLRI